jgi:hypothetical protein
MVLLFFRIDFSVCIYRGRLWDIIVWNQHRNIFGADRFIAFDLSDRILSFIVPLLALPQITHYILDGFIWRLRKDEFKWSHTK